MASRLQEDFELLAPPGPGATDWILLSCLGGSGRLQFPGNERGLNRGTLICCRPGTMPGLCATSGSCWDLILVRFRNRVEWSSWLKWPQQAPGVGLLEVGDEADLEDIERALLMILAGQQDQRRSQDALGVNLLERVFLLSQRYNPSDAPDRLDPRIEKAIKEIHLLLKADLNIDRLANIANVSRSRFSHLFSEQIGLSPQQYVETQRMHKAMHMLANTRRQIQDIASEVGYDDAFYFSSRFKRHCGMSPRQWRTTAHSSKS